MPDLDTYHGYEEKDLMLAQWETFHAGRLVDPQLIGTKLYKSWLRSREFGVNPHVRRKATVSPDELEAILKANTEVIDSSKIIMIKLFKSVEATNSIISLADRNGVILCVHYHQSSLQIMPNHVPGDIFSEEVCGTNGIGTCLAEAAPVELVGAEHYCRDDHIWYCSSAPIFDSKSNLVGVFNISIARESFHHHTSGMVEAAAYAITEQLSLREMLGEQAAIMELLDEGVIVLNNDGDITSINKKACDILKLDKSPVGSRLLRVIHAHEVLNTALNKRIGFHDQEVLLETGSASISCLLSAAPIPGKGVILTLRESVRMRELATRAIGAKAIYTFDRIIGDSASIKEAIRQGETAAQSDITTLILGESGTGKELFAQSIHNASARRKAPFVVVNCGAIPRNLVQAELFGYDEGAFTGANRLGKPGKFELADGGTIFLNEIGEMPLEAQVSLLRLLQNGEVIRVGGKNYRYVNVRVIAATNRNLSEAVAQKQFRSDLFYRLNAFTLHVPMLSDRGDDVVLLAESFLSKFALALRKNIAGIADETLHCLRSYPWPGNVRELENSIERAVAVATGSLLRPEDLPQRLTMTVDAPKTLSEGRLKEGEAEIIRQTLQDTRGNLRQTAQLLGISRSTLYLKLKKFQLDKMRFRN